MGVPVIIYPAGYLLVGLVLISGPILAAEVLRYEDADGVIHYVDDISRIPPAYRDQVDVLETESNTGAVEPVIPESSADLAAMGEGGVVTPVRISGNRVLVPVTVGYGTRSLPLTLLLDTGASSTLLDQEVARRLGVRNTRSIQGRVADGRTIQAQRGVLDFLQVGPLTVEKLDTAFMDRRGREQGYDGLLGMDFLRHFEYRIDFRASTIHWSRP